jgi:diguanylate cyclase (GGDEF)-like protein
MADALDRPQPLGWGVDPAVEQVIERFAVAAGGIDDALAMLVCLREALSTVVIETLPLDHRLEADRRLQMIIQRSMIATAHAWAALLADAALTDPLTGLGNRRAFERDLERHTGWSRRHKKSFAVAIVDVDGLKAVNDSLGHAAGDEVLTRVGTGLREVTRTEDGSYRLGGDEFGILLVAEHTVDADVIEARLLHHDVPPVTVGMAATPPDDPATLVAIADARMYERRRLRRSRAEAMDS